MRAMRLLLLLTLLTAPAIANAAPMLKGINLAGGEFGADKIPGEHKKDYLYPTPAVVSDYSRLGMNVIRVPFLWERIQPQLNGKLNEAEMRNIDIIVNAADTFSMTVILDMHNYAAYRGKLIGSTDVPVKAFAQAWSQLAKRYKDNPHVAFGIMNEPNKQEAEEWAKIAKSALAAIRGTGAKQLVLVPGTLYTGAHSWNQKAGKLSNAEALAKLKDPAGNMAIEIHHYFDYNYSGTHEDCTPPEVTEAALAPVSAWLKKNGHKGFLGEFGTPKSSACLVALAKALEHLKTHASVWKGWTYWGASEWFGTYPMNVYPPREDKFPQITVLKQYLK